MAMEKGTRGRTVKSGRVRTAAQRIRKSRTGRVIRRAGQSLRTGVKSAARKVRSIGRGIRKAVSGFMMRRRVRKAQRRGQDRR